MVVIYKIVNFFQTELVLKVAVYLLQKVIIF